MADIEFATDTKGLAKQLGQQYNTTRAELDKTQASLDESTKRIGTLKEAQAKERAPIVDKIRAKNAEPAEEYKPGDLPTFTPPTLDPKETNETIGTLAVLASMAGLLTNAPLTSALGAFADGVQGMIQGHEANYKKAEDKFKLDFQKAKTSNDELYRKVQDARARHKADLQGLINELTVLTAEHQDAIGSEMLRRGDLTGYMNKIEKQYDLFTKAATGIARIAETGARNQEQRRHNEAMEKAAQERLTASKDRADDKADKELFNVEKQLRVEADKKLKPLTEYQRTIEKVRASVESNMPLGDIEARQMLSELSKGARGTNMQMKITQNFGPLDTRIAGWYSNFVQGRMTDSQKQQIRDFLSNLERVVVQPERQQIVADYTRLAREAGANPLNVIHGDASGATVAPEAAPGSGGFDANQFLDQFAKGRPKGG